jgi:hypothetical protein
MDQDFPSEANDHLPDIVVDDLSDAQKIDFLTSAGDVSDLGSDTMLYHG